ncbi:helix-turn-helix domain-containing protein [Candidatus Poriferisocius sp.]|uniref:helix-turn-helix domain-containing protein n=1 Tax=Candidatus Poriferisocius sp. TaxID=3101276 RepID=UPI003B597D27
METPNRSRPFNTVGALGAELRRHRAAAGLTQQQLADRSGVSRRWIGLCEKGHPGAELGNLMRVARALGLALRFDQQPAATRQTL